MLLYCCELAVLSGLLSDLSVTVSWLTDWHLKYASSTWCRGRVEVASSFSAAWMRWSYILFVSFSYVETNKLSTLFFWVALWSVLGLCSEVVAAKMLLHQVEKLCPEGLDLGSLWINLLFGLLKDFCGIILNFLYCLNCFMSNLALFIVLWTKASSGIDLQLLKSLNGCNAMQLRDCSSAIADYGDPDEFIPSGNQNSCS